MRKQIKIAAVSAAVWAASASTVFADKHITCPDGTAPLAKEGCPVVSPLKESSLLGRPINSFFDIIDLMLLVILSVVGGIALIYLAWGGVQYITSGGDSKQVENARNKITSALMGLGIVLISWVIIKVIGAIMGKALLDIPF